MNYTFGSDVDPSAFVEDGSTPAPTDVESPPPLRPAPGMQLSVRDYLTKNPLPPITTGSYGWWTYTTDGAPVIEVSADDATWVPQIAVELRVSSALAPRVWYGLVSVTDAVREGDLLVDTVDVVPAVKVYRSGAWTLVGSSGGGASLVDVQTMDAQLEAKILARMEERLAAYSSGTTGTTTPGTGTTGGTTAPLAYDALYSTTFASSAGWISEKPGSSISGGQLLVGGGWMNGKMYVEVPGIVPGRRVRVTYTIAPGSTGTMLPLLDCIDASTGDWQWLDVIDGVNADQTYPQGKTFTASFTIPAGTTLLRVGVLCDSGTTVITDLVVEQSTSVAPLATASAAGPNKAISVPISAASWAFQNAKAVPLQPDSAQYVKALTDEVAGFPTVNANISNFNTSLWTATSSTPKKSWTYDNERGWTWTPTGMLDGIQYAIGIPTDPKLFIPGADDANNPNTDRAVAIYDPTTGRLWEICGVNVHGDGTYGMQQGWRTDNVVSWDGRYPTLGTGTSGSGLSHVPTNIYVEEILAGKIEHAMCLELRYPKSQSLSGAYVWPAMRSDGSSETPAMAQYAIPYGARFRLKDGAVKPAGLHRIASVIWDALNAGWPFIVHERTGRTAVAFDGDAQHQAQYGVNRWDQVKAGANDWDIFRGFPWGDLVLTQLGYKEA